ncbi:HDOD domain-containing protein [bacterium]|nr:HDOD domain-containing protein [bacterium]
MVSSRLSGSLTERRLERAVGHVSDFWIPVNDGLLQEIREELSAAESDSSAPQIIARLKGDFSLFFHALRVLSDILREEGASLESQDPILLLEKSSLDTLKKIFQSGDEEISRLSFDDGSDAQLARFHEMLVSSSTAVTLAESYGVDEQSAYSASVLRQLGLTLIAWNYPGMYQEVMNTLESGVSVEEAVSKRLGFSPQLLAIRLFQSWGYDTEFCTNYGLHDPAVGGEECLKEAMADTLVELCRVGESLARAHHPELYPSARSDWEEATQVITEKLGEGGVKKVQEKIDETLETYYTFMPEVYQHGLDGLYELVETPESEPLSRDIIRNPFLSCISPEVARSLRRLYQHIDGGLDAAVTTKVFVDEVIPVAQFSGGCVYTADPSIMMLMPQYPFGDLQLKKPQGVDYSVVLSNADIISLAFQDPEPVVEYRMNEAGELMTAVAGMFGGTQRVGVLYLELPEMVSDFEKDEQVLNFQAMRHALVECLRLT